MTRELEVKVTCLGRALEGEGKIRSTLPESEYDAFGEALRQSIVEIEEPDCAGCIDGRCVKCQRDGSAPKTRSRKTGASTGTFAMMGIGDRLYLEGLEDNAANDEDLYDQSGGLQEFLGNKESGHDDCGAAKGLVNHIKTVTEFSADGQTMTLVKAVVKGEHQDEDIDELARANKKNAVAFGDILESRGWDGQKYVDGIAVKNPSAVEELETKDDEVNGHAEDAVVFVDGPTDNDGRPIHTIDEQLLKKLTGREAFVINLNEIRRDAELLGHSSKQKAQLLLAGLTHTGAAFKNLADGTQPVFLVQVA